MLPLLVGAGSSILTTTSTTISDVVLSSTPLAQGESFTATWTLTTGDGEEPLTTGDLKVYAVELEPCASSAQSCCETGGNSQAVSLCDTCVDSDQSYDVEVPRDAAAGVYVVRISLKEDPGALFACSEGFAVQEEAPEEGGPGVEVVASSGAFVEALDGQGASPGQAFTARWYYEDGSEEVEEGEGGSPGDFAVDLYSCGDGACSDGRYDSRQRRRFSQFFYWRSFKK